MNLINLGCLKVIPLGLAPFCQVYSPCEDNSESPLFDNGIQDREVMIMTDPPGTSLG